MKIPRFQAIIVAAGRRSRWLSVDPLAKKYPGWSPYNYVEDNPTTSIDPNGDGGQGSNQPWHQAPVKLVGPREVNLGSISSTGFAQPSTSPVSNLLASFSNALERVSQATAMASAAFLAGGALTGTEEVTAPISGGLALTSYATELGSFGFKVTNYLGHHRGNLSGLIVQGTQLATEGVFAAVTIEAGKGMALTSAEETGKQSLEKALGAFFLIPGEHNSNTGAHGSGLQYLHPDATSVINQRP